MGFLDRELARISEALLAAEPERRRPELYAAQQALSWASDPTAFRSPYDMIIDAPTLPVTDIPEDSEDCLASVRRSQS